MSETLPNAQQGLVHVLVILIPWIGDGEGQSASKNISLKGCM